MIIRVYHNNLEDVIDFHGEQFHYLINVLRIKVGDLIRIFNQNGENEYSIVEFSKKSCSLEKIKTIYNQNNTPERDFSVFNATIKIAILPLIKKDNFNLIARQAVELGYDIIQPVIFDYSNDYELNYERLQKITTEALEQCRGNLPVVIMKKVKSKNLFINFNNLRNHLQLDKIITYLALEPEKNQIETEHKIIENNNLNLLIPVNKFNEELLQSNISIKKNINEKMGSQKNCIISIIGPEGGFSSNELFAINNIDKSLDLKITSLGSRIQKSETAFVSLSRIALDLK